MSGFFFGRYPLKTAGQALRYNLFILRKIK
ncbi:hypothetical protein SAMN05444338_106172 [Flavobacterium degerlachei]|uniref:Uncharacterized protein n=1 Tax=Flavobacterium degerlachei TaxID=229203 RepID=A0A1H2YF57_9FLAO|nr:hypothetical protein SAMN05444338_106172 [Flavobacterium degerlachei]